MTVWQIHTSLDTRTVCVLAALGTMQTRMGRRAEESTLDAMNGRLRKRTPHATLSGRT